MVELQAAYWRKQAVRHTRDPIRGNPRAVEVTANTAEPIKAHVTSSMEELRKWS